ncbi:MAG: riboflavin synthase [Nitrospirae bacterium]|nr:riboflavin synthase [Nitrospirota bacterium]
MFTGLIESTGSVSSIKRTGGGLRVSVRTEPAGPAIELQIGDSIAINGVCLTAVENSRGIVFDVSPETLRNTNLGELKINDKVNIERALRLSDRLGGHLVTGHVDGVGVIAGKKKEGEYTFYTFEASPEVLKYTVIKGSIAVDGISLTVINVDDHSFSVAIIPHTLTATNIGGKGIGDRVNLEVDIIGKYVEKFVSNKNNDDKLMTLLREKGFA